MTDVPFALRLLVFAAVVSLILIFDRRNAPAQRHRHREYSFLLVVGVVGAVFGLMIDAITSSISPDYFIDGKGLTAGPGFSAAVTTLGAQAGFSAGVIGASILLFANARRLKLLRLSRYVAISFAGSALLALTLGLLQHELQWLRLASWDEYLGPTTGANFTTVWCIHLGVYIGGLSGLLFSCVQLRRARRDA